MHRQPSRCPFGGIGANADAPIGQPASARTLTNHADTIGAMGLRDRFVKAPTHGGARLPLAGTATPATRLWHAEALGPCRATVTVDAIRLESGRQRFRVTETWTPPERGYGEIIEVTLHDDPVDATIAGKKAADDWRRGTARSALLAPGGRLRVNTPAGGPGTMLVPDARLELADPRER